MTKNQIVELTIEDIGSEGEGIGFLQENGQHAERGMAIFVKDTVPGDVAKIRIVKAKKNYAYGRLEEIVKPSPDRVVPPCPVARQCGGCQIQAMDYARQLAFKERKVINNLVRIGGFDEQRIRDMMEPIVGMETPYHYRNKAQFPVGCDREGNPVAGFYAGRTHSIIPHTDCLLGIPQNCEIMDVILTYMRANKVPAYQEESGRGLIRHVLIRAGFRTGQIMVCIVINGDRLPNEDKLVESLSALPNMTSVSVNINKENTNVIMGRKVRVLWGKEYIEDYIGEVKFRISPLSFYQVNPVQTEKLYRLALEYAGLTGRETVWDLYCGIGTISLFLAQRAAHVYGVEIVPEAIRDARENAAVNGLTNADFYVGKAEEVLPEQFEKNGIRADVIVVDPPRKGCDELCLNTMLKMQPERIVYVSCDSATLARDLKILCGGGYTLERVRAVDQFGHTVHVETVCLLSKKP
ncbi:MAG: 23S rRNA (uracil(1939)-C(5))-methyltransferase RlmD [Lachnospiraceae bacterium]